MPYGPHPSCRCPRMFGHCVLPGEDTAMPRWHGSWQPYIRSKLNVPHQKEEETQKGPCAAGIVHSSQEGPGPTLAASVCKGKRLQPATTHLPPRGKAWVHSPALPLSSHVSLGESHKPPQPQVLNCRWG